DPAKPLTCASYRAGPLAEAFVEPVSVGDRLPDLPVFLVADEYVPVPLETTYQAAFEAVPDFWREALTSPTECMGPPSCPLPRDRPVRSCRRSPTPGVLTLSIAIRTFPALFRLRTIEIGSVAGCIAG